MKSLLGAYDTTNTDSKYRTRDAITDRPLEKGGIFDNLGKYLQEDSNQSHNTLRSIVALATAAYLVKQYYDSMRQVQQEQIARQQEKLTQIRNDALNRHRVQSLTGKSREAIGYDGSDVNSAITRFAPITETSVYRHMDPFTRTSYAKYHVDRQEHTRNYICALDRHGTSLSKCRFFDSDGKEFDPYSIEGLNFPTAEPQATCMKMARSVTIQKSLIYAMDRGAVRCVMPDGQEFVPSVEVNDNFVNKYRETEQGFLKVDAAVAKERDEKISALSPDSIEALKLLPPNVNDPENRRNFIAESIIHVKADHGIYKNLSDNDMALNVERVLTQAGASKIIIPTTRTEKYFTEKFNSQVDNAIDKSYVRAAKAETKAEKNAEREARKAARREAKAAKKSAVNQDKIKKAMDKGEKMMDDENIFDSKCKEVDEPMV